jgi:MULE transposase-like protein
MSSSFESLLPKSFPTFAELEREAMGAAALAGFVLTRSNMNYSTEKVVLKGTFRCHFCGKSNIQSTSKRGTAKTDCPFKLNFRLGATEMTYHFTENCELAHNHPINPSSTTMTALARRFTPKQRDIVELMHANGSPASQVVTELRKTTDVIFRKKDVYNALQRVGRTHVDGVSDVQELLQVLDGHPDFKYVVKIDERNQLKGLTFACHDSLMQFRKMSFVLLMDATYGTNRFNMPFFIISSVDPFGQSYIVACSLLRDETTDSYDVALESFKKLFESTEPVVSTILTDQEQALINAIEKHFPDSTHQLCRWHLEKNLKKNFPKNTVLFSKFSEFLHSKYEFLATTAFYAMLEVCSEHETTYVQRLYDLRKKYVELWVCRNKNLGMRTTQRTEGLNYVFKLQLKSTSTLSDLFFALEKMNMDRKEACALLEFQMWDRPRMYHSLISSMVGRVPRFILELVNSECSNMNHLVYHVEEECAMFNDSHQCSVEQGCDCPFFLQYSAPCAHCFVFMGEGALSLFYPFWVVNDTVASESAILQGPKQEEPQVSLETKKRAEFAALVSELQTSLYDMEVDLAIGFVRKFQDMLRRNDINAPPVIQDPPIVRPRGRPRKAKKNTFKGGKNIA